MKRLLLRSAAQEQGRSHTKTWFVSRHGASIEWVQSQGFTVDEFVTHLDADHMPKSGDTVIGTLPVHVVADLNQKGVRFLHLKLDLNGAMRGKELSLQDLEAANASLQEYLVWKVTRD